MSSVLYVTKILPLDFLIVKCICDQRRNEGEKEGKSLRDTEKRETENERETVGKKTVFL